MENPSVPYHNMKATPVAVVVAVVEVVVVVVVDTAELKTSV